MKLKIKDLEKKLNKKIKINYKVVGLDTAKKTGVCFIKTTKDYIYIDWCKLEFDYNNQEEMLKNMFREFGQLFSDENLDIIEEVFVGFSRTGSIHLAKMGTIAIAQCINKNINFKLILAKSARAKFFVLDSKKWKGKTKQAVGNYLESIEIKTDDEDVNDAIILALCGICEGINFEVKKTNKKRNGCSSFKLFSWMLGRALLSL